MAFWQDAFHEWAQAWAAMQDSEAVAEGSVAVIASRRLALWPGDVQHVAGTELLLLTDDPAGAAAFAQAQGLQAGERLTVLSAQTDDLDLVPDLPANAYLAEAPMGDYDVIEVALFDRPAARGRLTLADGFAVLSGFEVDPGNEELAGTFEVAMVAGLGEEAFAHGADTMYLVAGAEQAERFATVEGWNKVAEILSFS